MVVSTWVAWSLRTFHLRVLEIILFCSNLTTTLISTQGERNKFTESDKTYRRLLHDIKCRGRIKTYNLYIKSVLDPENILED
jgi:hypothetical protein